MAKGKNYLKGRFETGDVPSQSDFEDLIDSAVNLADDVDGTIPDSPAAGHVPTSGAVKSYVAAEVAKLPSKAEVTQLSSKVGNIDTSKGTLVEQVLGGEVVSWEQITESLSQYSWNLSVSVGDSYTGNENKARTQAKKMKLQVRSGDSYRLFCGVASTTLRQYLITDSNNVVLTKGGYSADHSTTPIEITIAEDGWLFVNFYTFQETYEGESVGDRLEKKTITQTGGYKAYVNSKKTESDAYANSAVASSKPLNGKNVILVGDSQIGTLTASFDTEVARVTGATIYNCGFGGMRYTDTWDTPHHKAFCMIGVTDALTSGDFSAMDAAVSGGGDHFPAHLSNLKSVYAAMQGTEGDGFIMTIEYGSNDFANGKPLGSHGNVNTTSVIGAQEYALNNLLTTYPKLKIIIVGLPWRVESYTTIDGVKTITSTSDDKTATIGGQVMHRVDYSDAIIENARTYYHIPSFDYYRNCGRNIYNAFKVGSDGCHPTNRFGSLLAADYYIKVLTSTN